MSIPYVKVNRNTLTKLTLKYGFIIIFDVQFQKVSFYNTIGNEKSLCNFACDDIIIKKSLSDKFLEITKDNNLDFSDHMYNIRKTANQKLNAIFRVSARMNADKCSLLINSFIKSHFICFLLILMFCNRKSMKEVNEIQEPYFCLMANNWEL